MSRITLKFFPVTPQTLLTTENLCFKQKLNFSEKELPLLSHQDLPPPRIFVPPSQNFQVPPPPTKHKCHSPSILEFEGRSGLLSKKVIVRAN